MSVGNGSMVALLANDQTHVKRIYDLALSLDRVFEGGRAPAKANRDCAAVGITRPISGIWTAINSTPFAWGKAKNLLSGLQDDVHHGWISDKYTDNTGTPREPID